LQKVPAGEPRYVPSIVADKITAVHAAYGVTLALLHRERTSRGGEVKVPMLETMTAFTMQEHLGGAVFEPALGPMGHAPVRQGMRKPFRTRDGFICLMPYTDANWRQLLELVERPDLAADPGLMTLRGRQADIERVWNQVGELAATRSNAEWERLLCGSDIPYAVLNDLEDLLDDPHLVATGFWEMREHPTEGTLRMPAPPLQMPGSPASIRRLPPHLGEHTQEVLREFGFCDATHPKP
jgi:crotonobetainyl-CoA:carnitine CoA-transferase CaiB-like acyl-CoA transferase